MRLDGCTAVITGASAGIGWEFARQLAPRARTLVLVARRQERLDQLTQALQMRNRELRIKLCPVDLSLLSDLDRLVRRLEAEKLEIDLLINNAGLGDAGPFATSPQRRNLEMLQVNIVALTTLTRALLPQMIARKRGAILNVSSSAGFLPIPEFNVYAATKAYVNSFSESLRAELRKTGVTVTALCPGPVHTEFGDVAKRPGRRAQSGPEFTYVSIEEVVREALAGVEADKPVVVPGLVMKIGMFLVRITPIMFLRLAWRLGAKRAS